MTATPNRILIGALAVFALGAGVIVYNGRPAARMARNAASSAPSVPTVPTASVPASTTAPAPSADGTYAMADVQAHATLESCWAAIGGDVYDLTTWVGRHPGGPRPIQGLCGTDGTERFTRKHGSSAAPKAALALLKIGTLKK